MKKILLFTLLFMLSIGLIISNPINANQDEVDEQLAQQIGYVNMQKLFQNHPQKKSSEQQLETAAQELKKELETRGKTMDKEERQELLQKYQDQLSQQEQELIEAVLADINKKINQVAAEKDISVVLDKSTVIYGGHNLTAAVLDKINADYEAQAEQEDTTSMQKTTDNSNAE